MSDAKREALYAIRQARLALQSARRALLEEIERDDRMSREIMTRVRETEPPAPAFETLTHDCFVPDPEEKDEPPCRRCVP